MDKKILLPLLMLAFAMNAFSQQYLLPGKKIFNKDSITSFLIKGVDGQKSHLAFPSKELMVIAFLSPECPICKNYSPRLAQIKNKYANKAAFIGIIPGSFEASDVEEFQKKSLPSWKLFRDTSLLLTHYLEGKVTPEVLVIDTKNGLLLYKGAIDDWVVSLGKTRTHIANFYLETALINFINNKPVIPFTSPVGCLINDF
ncbi:MAG: thioredoxin domain-containing protein [Ginsengibacter sp.]